MGVTHLGLINTVSATPKGSTFVAVILFPACTVMQDMAISEFFTLVDIGYVETKVSSLVGSNA